MGEMQSTKKSSQWVIFIGVILILLGIFGIAKTCINILAFERYPQEGVYPPLPIFQSAYPRPYGGREEDCIASYTYIPYPPYPAYDIGVKGESPAMSPEEIKKNEEMMKAQQELQKQNCLSGVKEAREMAKVNDLSQSILFLFMGAGVLLARKIFGLDK